MRRIFLAVTIGLMARSAMGADAAYDLFHPVPADALRELSPDRPDKSTGPFTVDAGHYQLEADFANYTYNRDGSVRAHGWNVAPAQLRIGIARDTELSFTSANYFNVTQSDKAAHTRTHEVGRGDIAVGFKHNFWGNDGGKTAFGIVGAVSLPASSHGLGETALQGGVDLPLAIQLSKRFDLTLMTGVNAEAHVENHGYSPAFINSASLGMEWTETVGAFAEIYTQRGLASGDRFIATFDTGMNYMLGKNTRLDAGANFGLTRAAPDFNPFVGITQRF